MSLRVGGGCGKNKCSMEMVTNVNHLVTWLWMSYFSFNMWTPCTQTHAKKKIIHCQVSVPCIFSFTHGNRFRDLGWQSINWLSSQSSSVWHIKPFHCLDQLLRLKEDSAFLGDCKTWTFPTCSVENQKCNKNRDKAAISIMNLSNDKKWWICSLSISKVSLSCNFTSL